MKEFANLIEKTYRAYRIYPKGHEIPKHFLRQLWEKLKDLFTGKAELSFYTERNKLLDEEGKVILEGEENEDNFAWFLYKGGIKGVVITPSVSLFELKEFFETFRDVTNLDKDKYALLAALNNKNFEGIYYEITPEFLEDENVFIPETYQEFRKLKEKEPKAEPVEIEEKPVAKIEIPIIVESREVFKITFEEEQSLQEEIERERQENKLDKLLEYLNVLLRESDMENFGKIMDAIEELLLIEIKNKNLERVNFIFRNLKSICNHGEKVLWAGEKIPRIEALFRKLSDGKLLRELFGGEGFKEPLVETFISYLKPQVAIDLLEIASKAEKKSFRNAILAGIAKIENIGVDKIIQYLRSNLNNKELLLTGIELLGLLNDKNSLNFLAQLQSTDDEEIKIALVKSIFSLGGDITPFLNDRNLKVRLTAYQELKKNPDEKYAEFLAARILNPAIYNFEHLEKQIFFSLAANYLENEVVRESIKRLLNYNPSFFKKIFENKRILETIGTLLHALAETKSPRAFELLLEGVTTAKYGKVREMCKDALKNFGGDLYGGNQRN